MSDNPAGDVRPGEELDVARIDAVLKRAVDGLAGTPRVGQYTSGASNLTYALDYPGALGSPGRRLVLRRPPFGTKPKSGHDMKREYRIMTALKPVFPAVPATVFYSDDIDIIGAEFFVMERADGHLLQTNIPAAWGWNARTTGELCEAFFSKLVELHQVDFGAIGLADFGRPDGYVKRQIAGWDRRFERAWTPDIETFEDVRGWLGANLPAGEGGERGAAILHGDFRIDNCILKTGDPRRIDAILDWEICALGDPLMDLGNTLSYWIEANDPAEMLVTLRQPSHAPGMMTRREVLEFYSARTGADTSDFRFYRVYGLFRLAAILQQIYYRAYHGETNDPRFTGFRDEILALGRQARRVIATGDL